MSGAPQSTLKTISLTFFTLIAFAANSVLCRLALGESTIDAASFSTLRLLSGAVTLWLLVVGMRKPIAPARYGNWISALMLFLYAVAFSFAYITLEAGTGALILFGAVQATMILVGLKSGERPGPLQWTGLALALGGLAYLVSPGLTAPSPVGSGLMVIAGVAWGIYSIRGRGIADPLGSTAGNFMRSVPFAVGLSLLMLATMDLSGRGAVLAIVSGSVTSGLGYVLWYAALRGLTTTRAAVVQLSVPVLASIGGVFFLSEDLSARLIVASGVVLGGVGLTVLTRDRSRRNVRSSQ
jgi:drug/metabolite transporter (DMT)-like permease